MAAPVRHYTTALAVINGPLRGFDLSSLGDSSADCEAYVERLLLASKAILDNTAGRDFDSHTADVITLDGNDANRIAVWKDDATLCAPIVSVTGVSVYDEALDIADLKINAQAGLIGFREPVSDRLCVRRALRRRTSIFAFPRDWQNVQVTLNWGYTTPPPGIPEAQQLLVACFTAITLSGADFQGLTARKIEDFEEQYREGPYSQQVRRWTSEAKTLLRSYRVGFRHG